MSKWSRIIIKQYQHDGLWRVTNKHKVLCVDFETAVPRWSHVLDLNYNDQTRFTSLRTVAALLEEMEED